jgi:hypothetical protein
LKLEEAVKTLHQKYEAKYFAAASKKKYRTPSGLIGPIIRSN